MRSSGSILLAVAVALCQRTARALVVPGTTFTAGRHYTHCSQSPFLVGHARSSNTALFMGTNRRARRQKKKEAFKSRDQKFYDAVKSKKPTDDDDIDPDRSISGVKVAAGKKKKTEMKKETTTSKGKTAAGTKDNKAKLHRADEEIDTDHTHYHEKIKHIETPHEEETPLTAASSVADAPTEEQPELSTVVVDEETGFERIAQGKAVMDVVTRKAVKLSDLGPEYRMAQFSPGVPPEVRARYRFQNWDTIEVPEMIAALREACVVPIKNETTGETKVDIPPHPSVANTAIDFVLANRDLLGMRMKKTLGRLKMRAQSLGNVDEARSYRVLWKHFLTLENHISAPFRQMVIDAESKIGPQFGNLDLASYAGGEMYERAASYIVLKGMVAHWEKKYNDAKFVESTPMTQENFMTVLGTGDPKRYLPDPPVIFRLDECTKICAMAQRMSIEFVNNTALFDDLPVELRFIEKALTITGGTELRRFMNQDFCPAEGVSPEALIEGVWRLYEQMVNMQIDPYGDLTNVVGRMAEALAVGTDRQRDPYAKYLYNFDRNGPGYFQTYTLDEDENSLMRFLDSSRRVSQDTLEGPVGTVDDVVGKLGSELQELFGGGGGASAASESEAPTSKEGPYEVPEKRAVGRPHNLGWLNLLEEDRVENKNIYESDNWREAND